MSKLKIGIIGCGAIGSSLAKTISLDFAKQAKLSALYDIDIAKSQKLAKSIRKDRCLAALSPEDLIRRSDLVVEAASARVSFNIAKQALQRKRDILVMSVGGIINNYHVLFNLAKRYNRHVYIPSGAICGIDALKAAGLAKIKSVTLTTIKNPDSFQNVKYIAEKGIKPEKIKKELLIFSGSASEAVKYFPQNINVAAILSLAGIGQFKTKVKIIASPKVHKNIHEIEIISEAGIIRTRTENVLHPANPKTSYLAFLSAVAVLKGILEPIRIGS